MQVIVFLFRLFLFWAPSARQLLFLYGYEMVPGIAYDHTRDRYITAATVCMSAARPRHILCIPDTCLLRTVSDMGLASRTGN